MIDSNTLLPYRKNTDTLLSLNNQKCRSEMPPGIGLTSKLTEGKLDGKRDFGTSWIHGRELGDYSSASRRMLDQRTSSVR